ncbi:MAG: imidazole glycerol phosphate synthase subunit HisH [Microbacterium sp.]|nr:MAG: imidazole glycerol phosphate synthase subunit HisH [Microbacterium sp.]PZU35680.1 MAG: imidazole glycerol phosphate synthase subunit HisH [Microbacterium sp.]
MASDADLVGTDAAGRAAVTIVDHGVGNLGSLKNALARVGATAVVSSDPDEVARAERIILAGVGAFDRAMSRLNASGLGEAIILAAQRGTPVAGVCLGMQLLLDGSDEGQLPGLGLIHGRATRFPSEIGGRRLLVPHMGWSGTTPAKPSALCPALSSNSRFYFVHSFAAEARDEQDVLAWTTYGLRYASAVERENIIGVQFHPEKSHRYGLAVLRDFAESKA